MSYQLLGNGVYSFSEAARLTGLRNSRVREWFRGRPSESHRAVFRSDYEGLTDENLISFMDLIEVFIAGQLREFRVSLQIVRQVHSKLKLVWETNHPFCRKEVLTDGQKIFTLGLDAASCDEITEALTGQKAFPSVIRPFLRSLDYDEANRCAFRWRIANRVIVDPGICFGQPVVQPVGLPTVILSNAYVANGNDAEAVARWYEITTQDVLAAVEFEKHIAA